MECSTCHSTNLVKVSLAFEQGLSDLEARSRVAGLVLGTEGLGFWSGRAKTTGTLQTRLSTRLSPPAKLPYWKALLAWLIGLLVVGITAGYLSALYRVPDQLFEARFGMFE